MIFLQKQYFIPLIFALVVLVLIFMRNEASFFKWVKDHWFFKRTKKNIVASFLYYIGFSLIALALLDLRGPEEYIQGKISEQKTIIMIDSSASMMAEDVRPNRFEKALVLAKHYVRKAVGQQISITVFSDLQKRIIPFTSDIDLIDARLDALKNMNLNRGGTSLTYSIKEALQYLKDTSSEASGNILIFTDAEETDGGIDLSVPKEVTVGVVGIGTAKGSAVPMRNSQNVFIGNKKYKGETVISKLDESFLKKLGQKVKNYRYWVAGSYSLPTEQIVSFFSRIHKIKESENSFRVRPVLHNYLLVPGVILLLISFIFKNMKTFIYIGMLLITLNIYTAGAEEKEGKKEPEKSQQTLALEKKFEKGVISYEEKRLLANQLLKEGFAQQSRALYSEILEDSVTEKNIKDYFNYGASQLKSKNIASGLDTYKKLYKYLEKNPQKDEAMLKSVKDNMLKAIQGSAGQSGNKDDKDKNQDQQDQTDSQDSKGNNKQNNDKNKSKDKNSNQDGEKQKEEQNKNKDQKQKDKNQNDEKKKKENKPEQSQSEMDKKKTPAILKQLMSDDNKIQKKMIDTGTTSRNTREKRDW